MYTQCPECHTVFRVKAEQLEIAHGKVRCSHCNTVFNALETLKQDNRDNQNKQYKHSQAKQETQTSQDTITKPQTHTQATKDSEDNDRTRYANYWDDEESPFLLEDELDSQLKTARFGTQQWLYLLASLLLIASFSFQSMYYLRLKLAETQQWRPWVEKVCQIAQCQLPKQRNLKAIVVNHLDIRPHPIVKNALLINLSLVNRASFPQDYPLLQLSLTHSNGKVFAQRRFTPAEYLKTTETKVMKSHHPIHIVLELGDPGQEATGFQVDFF